MKTLSANFAVCLLSILISASTVYAQQSASTGPEVSAALLRGETPAALADLPVAAPAARNAPRPRRVVARPTGVPVPDEVLQTEPLPAEERSGPETPTLGSSFDGLGSGFSGPGGRFNPTSDPPDTNIAVGKSQVVEMVNTSVAVYDKTTKKWVAGPTDLSKVWGSGFRDCQLDDGDPIVVYDRLADRWVLTQMGGNNFQDECVAVSQTADATGKYYLYEFNPAPSLDYPKVSAWSDAYYFTVNEYSAGGSYQGAGLCAWDRSKMLIGAQASMICFNSGTAYDTVLSADLDGATAPPSGSPNYMIALNNNNHRDLVEWKFHVDFANPSKSTLTGPNSIPVAAFNPICPNTFNCVPQKGTNQKIDALGNIVMFRLAYRNFGSYESLTAVHTVATTAAAQQTAERWYEIRDSGATSPTLYQQSTWAPDTTIWRFMASIAQDKQGNMLLGYSVSDSSLEPGIRYTGRLVTDPLNKMQSEATMTTGSGYHAADRWGDYSSMLVDPSDDCTFWYANEYQTTHGTLVWHTRIASVKWTGCQ